MSNPPNPARLIAFQGEPGAYSDLACRQVFPRRRTLPCATFEDAIAAVRRGRAALAMLPIENSVAGRVADYPSSAAQFGAPHHRRALSAREPPSAGREGRAAQGLENRAQPRPCAVAMQEAHPRARVEGRDRGRHRGLRRRSGAARRQTCGGDRLGPRGEDLRPRIRSRRTSRTRRITRRASSIMAKEPKPVPNKGLVVTTFVFRSAQRAGRALQGLGRVCHERHQHDQARELHDRRPLHRDAVLCRCRGPSRRNRHSSSRCAR